jgi:hypothetical protein
MNVTVMTPWLTWDSFFTQQPGVAARWPVPRCLIVTTSNVSRSILIAVFRLLAGPGWVDLTRTRVSDAARRKPRSWVEVQAGEATAASPAY